MHHRYVVGADTHGHTAEHHVFRPSHSEDVASVQRADPDEMYVITILFFYTRQFADDFRDRAHMEDEIQKSVDLLNLALHNSHVNATFRIVGIERDSAMPTRQFRAEEWIVNNARARSRRDEVGADLVYALVDDPTGVAGLGCLPSSFAPSTGEQCFYGSVNNWTPSVRAFDNENVWQTILRHEVGHNLGIQHSPEFGGNPRGGFFPGAVGYSSGPFSTDPDWYGTVMGANYLPRFSSSSERFEFRGRSLVVGERGVHEASTALLHSISPVSRYRATAPPTFSTGTTIPDQRWTEGAMIELLELPAAGGGDGDISYSLRPALPGGVVFDDSSRILSGRPAAVSGPAEYTYSATDAEGRSASLSFTIEVVEPERNCRSTAAATCLQGSRYEVTVDWWTADGQSGEAAVADVGTADSGLFWFFSSTNWELLVKVLDACAVNDHHWVFGAATTDLGYRVKVTDTESGSVREYRNEAGRAAQAIADVTAFPEACAEAGAAVFSRVPESLDPLGPPRSLESEQTAGSSLVLQKGRFDVRVQWTTEDGETGPASAAPERTVDSGLFWFFEPSNWEMLVKVLDGCGVNDHYWVLAGSATTLGFEIRVTDTQAGAARHYTKTDRRERAAAFVDSAAFPCGRSASKR